MVKFYEFNFLRASLKEHLLQILKINAITDLCGTGLWYLNHCIASTIPFEVKKSIKKTTFAPFV
tara:strand:- start:158693 stop:158884 length:192 start_codon:yes stop_codon:yes gene_type:complete